MLAGIINGCWMGRDSWNSIIDTASKISVKMFPCSGIDREVFGVLVTINCYKE